MKKLQNVGFFKKLWLGALLACAISTTHAQTFSYNVGDLVVALRQTAGGTYDLVVNAGPVSNFTNLPAGTKVTITSLTGTLLNSAFTTTNGLSWSAFACFDATYPVAAEQQTLFMTRPRSDLNTQTTPWTRKSKTSQGTVRSYANGVGSGAVSIGSGLPSGANNGPTFLVEQESASALGSSSYYVNLGTALNWHGSFGVPEQNTSATFTAGGSPVRSDFYWLVPSNTSLPGTYLGYFEFNTNGVLTYTAGPSPSVVVEPQIVSIVRTGTTTTVYFTTGSGGTYSLLASGDLNASKATWPTVGSSVTGNGQTNSISEASTSGVRYYSVKAQ